MHRDMSFTLTTPHSPFAATRETRSRKKKKLCVNTSLGRRTCVQTCRPKQTIVQKRRLVCLYVRSCRDIRPVTIMGKYVIQTGVLCD